MALSDTRTRDEVADDLDDWYSKGEAKMEELCMELPYDAAVRVRQWYLDGRAGLDARIARIRRGE